MHTKWSKDSDLIILLISETCILKGCSVNHFHSKILSGFFSKCFVWATKCPSFELLWWCFDDRYDYYLLSWFEDQLVSILVVRYIYSDSLVSMGTVRLYYDNGMELLIDYFNLVYPCNKLHPYLNSYSCLFFIWYKYLLVMNKN